jgi:hypothetical protein
MVLHAFVRNVVLAVVWSSALTVSAVPTSAPSAAAAPTKDQLAFFEAKVRPLLAANCYECHSVEERKSKGD